MVLEMMVSFTNKWNEVMEMEKDTTQRYCFTPKRWTKIKKCDNTNCWCWNEASETFPSQSLELCWQAGLQCLVDLKKQDLGSDWCFFFFFPLMIYSRGNVSKAWDNTRVFKAALLLVAKHGKQPTCLSQKECVPKRRTTHSVCVLRQGKWLNASQSRSQASFWEKRSNSK